MVSKICLQIFEAFINRSLRYQGIMIKEIGIDRSSSLISNKTTHVEYSLKLQEPPSRYQ